MDGNGSTIAMVDSASGNVASTYTYDPFGKASYEGSYITAYQWRGMENDTWAYYGGGGYYSPLMGRPLTIQGPITSAGGFGAGPGAMVGGALPGGSGSNPTGLEVGAGTFVAADAAITAAQAISLSGDFASIGALSWSAGPEAGAVATVAEAIYDILDLFGVFGGGGPSYPWWYIREATHPGGMLPIWAPIEGLPAAYPPNQGPSAGTVQLIQELRAPQAPQYQRPGSPSQRGMTPEQMGRMLEFSAVTIGAGVAGGWFVGSRAGALVGAPFGPEGAAVGYGVGGAVGAVSGGAAGVYLAYRTAMAGAIPHMEPHGPPLEQNGPGEGLP